MARFAAAVAISCLVVAGLHGARLVMPGAVAGADRFGEAVSGAMAIGMAAMFSPLGNPVSAPVWTVLFAVCAVGSAALAVRARTVGGDPGHHLLGSGAMLFMLLGHEHDGTRAAFGLASVVALVLAGYFGWHVLRCLDRYHATGGPLVAGTPRVTAAAQVASTATMAFMLIGMV